MTSGERRVGVDFNPSGSTMVDTIKRKAADLIDHINGLETADFNEPGEVARLKVLAMTDIESAAIWSVKASARSGAAQRRLVATLQQFCDAMDWPRQRCWSQAFERVKEATTAAPAAEPAPGTSERMTTDEMAKALIDGGVRPQGAPRQYIRQLRLWVGCDGELARGAPITRCLATPAPHVEVPHTTPAARLDRCPPRDPNPTRRCVAPRTKTASRHTPSTFSPRHTGRATAPDAAARWRCSSGPQAASTRLHPRTASTPLCGLPRAGRGAPTLSASHRKEPSLHHHLQHPGKAPYARGTTPGTDHPTMPARDLRTALASVHSGESAPNADSAALMRTTARCTAAPCTRRAACAAASALRPQHLVARVVHNRGNRIND